MPTDDAAALLPCPFCGEVPLGNCYCADQGDKWGRVVCGCGAQGPEVRTSYNLSEDAPWHARANEEWNRRSQAALLDGAREVWLSRERRLQLFTDLAPNERPVDLPPSLDSIIPPGTRVPAYLVLNPEGK